MEPPWELFWIFLHHLTARPYEKIEGKILYSLRNKDAKLPDGLAILKAIEYAFLEATEILCQAVVDVERNQTTEPGRTALQRLRHAEKFEKIFRKKLHKEKNEVLSEKWTAKAKATGADIAFQRNVINILQSSVDGAPTKEGKEFSLIAKEHCRQTLTGLLENVQYEYLKNIVFDFLDNGWTDRNSKGKLDWVDVVCMCFGQFLDHTNEPESGKKEAMQKAANAFHREILIKTANGIELMPDKIKEMIQQAYPELKVINDIFIIVKETRQRQEATQKTMEEILHELKTDVRKTISDARQFVTEKDTNESSKIGPEDTIDPYAQIPGDKKDLYAYLLDLNKETRVIRLPAFASRVGTIELPLENVYVSLRVSRNLNTMELRNANQLLAKRRSMQKSSRDTDENNLLMSARFDREPIRGRNKRAVNLQLTEAYRDYQVLIILGSPGIGKSTLQKWMAYTLSQFKLREISENELLYIKIDPRQRDKFISTGNSQDDCVSDAKLPILIRIPEYAKEYVKKIKEKIYPLDQYIGANLFSAGDGRGHMLNENMLAALQAGRAAVLLDGLDEVNEYRTEIKDEVERFINTYLDCGSDFRNKFIITSRETGYHQAPLLIDSAAHFSIEGMSPDAIELFCRNWLYQYYKSLDKISADLLIRAKAATESEILINAIRPKEDSPLKALAQNPLLLTIIAIIFEDNKSRLPTSKIELYERASKTLIKRNCENIKHAGNEDVDEKGLEFVFTHLALNIHESRTDDVLESFLESKISKYLAEYRGKEVSRATRNIIIDEIGVNGGVMMATSMQTYRFVHRQIQEYFVANYFLITQETQGQRIMEHLGDPIWYEPIILTLGLQSKKNPVLLDQNIDDIIKQDENLSDVLPRGALFILSALPEISNIKREKVIQLVFQVLNVYNQKLSSYEYNILDEKIENVLDAIYKGKERKLLEEAISLFLSTGAYSRQTPSIALLLNKMSKRGWIVSRWKAHFFNSAIPDSAEKGFPIDALSRKMASIKENANFLKTMPLRNFLVDNADAVEFVRSNPEWLRLIIALYGGLEDLDLGANFLEYETVRKEYQEQRGSKEHRRRLAIRLDTQYGNEKRNLGTYPSFYPENIYRTLSEDFDQKFIELLTARAPTTELLPFLSETIKGPSGDTLKSAAFIAIIALGMIKEGFVDFPPGVIRELKRLQYFLKDSIVQLYWLANVKDEFVKDIFTTIREDKRKSLLDIMLYAFDRAGFPFLDIQASLSGKRLLGVEDYKEKCSIESEFWIYSLFGASDDAVYSMVVKLDTIGKNLKQDPDLFLGSIAAIPITRYRLFSGNDPGVAAFLPFNPFNHGTKRLLIAAFDSILEFPKEFDFVKDWALWSLQPYIDNNPELLAEFLLTALGISPLQRDKIKTVHPRFWEDENRTDMIGDMIEEISDPYLKFRALYKLYFLKIDPKIIPKINDTIELLSRLDPAEYFMALEMLYFPFALGLLPINALSDLFKNDIMAMVDIINTIADSDDRCTAFCILAIRLYPEMRMQVLHKAFLALTSITDLDRKAFLVAFIKKNLPLEKVKEDFLPFISESFADSWFKNIISAQSYKDINALIGIVTPDKFVGLTCLSLYLTAMEICDLIPEEAGVIDKLFRDLLREETRKDALKEIALKGKDGIKINESIATVIMRLGSDGETLEAILPLCESPDVHSLTGLRIKGQGQFPPEHLISLFICLLQAENNTFTPTIFDALLQLLQYDNDRIRARAQVAIHGKYCTSGMHIRRKRSSVLGKENLTHIYTKMMEIRKRPSKLPVYLYDTVLWIDHDLYHDSCRLIDELRQSEKEAILGKSVSGQVLASIESCSPEVFNHILEILNVECNKDLVRSVIRIIYSHSSEFKSRFNISATISPAIRNCINRESYKDYTFSNLVDTLIHICRANADLLHQKTAYDMLIFKCREHFDKYYTISIKDSAGEEEILNCIDKIAMSNIYWDKEKAWDDIEIEIVKLNEYPVCIPLFINWALEEISLKAEMQRYNSHISEMLSLLLAVFADIYPDTFKNHLDPDYAVEVLLSAIKNRTSWVFRRGVIYLLSHIELFSDKINAAYCASLKDVFFVREGVEKCYKYFARIEKEEEIEPLLVNLRSASGLIVSSSAKILSEVCLNRKTNPEIRKRIRAEMAKVLAEYTQNTMLNKGIYFFDEGKSKIVFIDFVENVLYSELLKISGIN